MKAAFKLALMLLLTVTSTVLMAQRPGNPQGSNPNTFDLGDNDPTNQEEEEFTVPLNDITAKRTKIDRRILPYEDVREADIMWQKRVWRVLDVREKINLPFANPDRPLITILMEAADSNQIQLYSTLDDKFTEPLSQSERDAIAGGVDTIQVPDPETYEITYKYVPRELNPEEVRRYRLQEIWFFDKESSTMKVRIMGIAPLKDVYGESGEFRYELPMFWVYYPDARQVLANESAYVVGNDAANRSWEDVFESRYFNSYIIKESNVLNRRIDNMLTDGRERLMEAERIKQEILNKEQDLWSY